jgi:cell division protease FtsH
MVQLEGITGEYLDRRRVLECSDETATIVDEEVKMIINNAYALAYKLLSDNVAILDAVATYLIDHESITGKEFMEIFDQVTGGIRPKTPDYGSLTSGDITKGLKIKPLIAKGKEKIKAKKLKDKNKNKDKIASSADAKEKKKKDKDKYRVFASPEFEARRDQLLQEAEEDLMEEIDEEVKEEANAVKEEVVTEAKSVDETKPTTEEKTVENNTEPPKPWETTDSE